jgi:hypothetical protein
LAAKPGHNENKKFILEIEQKIKRKMIIFAHYFIAFAWHETFKRQFEKGVICISSCFSFAVCNVKQCGYVYARQCTIKKEKKINMYLNWFH